MIKGNINVGYQEIHVSDQSTYNAVLKDLNPKQSQFFFSHMMQNHAPFIAGEPSDVTASGKGFSEDECLTNCSRLLTFTGQSTKIS